MSNVDRHDRQDRGRDMSDNVQAGVRSRSCGLGRNASQFERVTTGHDMKRAGG